MNLQSPKVSIPKSSEYIFNALTDVKNFEKLMPESIAKFEVIGEDSFIFALKGMPEITLKKKEEIPNSKIILGAASDKLPFTLTGEIKELDAENCEVQLHFEGNFNPMMAMMVKGPIGKFIEALVSNMGKL
jgi:ribosome-associated toxin RatA of RatAB toxin-antitoxin module